MGLLSFAKRLRALAKKTFDDAIVNTVKETNQPSKLIQFIINLGQTSHKVITRTERCLYGLANDSPIQELDRMRAFHAGSNLLAKLYLYTVAGGTVILEVQSDISALRKEKLSVLRKEKLRMELQEIVMLLAELHTQKQLELHGGKTLQLHSPKKTEATPNQDELDQNA